MTKAQSMMVRLVLTALHCVVAAAIVIAQTADSSGITSNSRWPLSEIADKLEQRHGVVITYEDPPYVHSSQIEDVTKISLRGRKGNDTKLFAPKGGPFAFSYVVAEAQTPSGMRSVLNRLVTEYESTGYAGRFKVMQSGDILHIVPTTARRRQGNDQAFGAILSTEISLARTDERSALDAVGEITAALTRATGVRVSLGMAPLTFLANTRLTISVSNEAARSVLTRVVEAAGSRLTWRMRYIVDEPGYYMLSFRWVAPAKQAP